MTGVIVRKKSERPWREPRSSDEIRCEYIMQVWDMMQQIQDENDKELDKWLSELTYDDRQKPYVQEMLSRAAEDNNRDFMVELMDSGDVAWAGENVFAFSMPNGYVCDQRVLDIIGSPTECWSRPSVSIGLEWLLSPDYQDRFPVDAKAWDGRLVISVLLIDG